MGRRSVRSLIEEKSGLKVWDLIDGVGSENIHVLSKTLSDKFFGKISVSEPVLMKIIQQGIDSKEIPESKYARYFIMPPRKKKTEVDPNGEVVKTEEELKEEYRKASSFSFNTHCQCGHHWKQNRIITDNYCLMSLRACRCPKCLSWGKMTVSGVVNGVMIRKTTVTKEDTITYEVFVDEKGKEIENPFFKKKAVEI